MLLISRINVIKTAILQKEKVPLRIPTQYFAELGRAILNLIWENTKYRIGKTLLKIKELFGSVFVVGGGVHLFVCFLSAATGRYQ